MSGVLFAQGDPTDTPTVRALTGLLPLRRQADYGVWLSRQARDARFAEWLGTQASEAQFAEWLGTQASEAQFADWLGSQAGNAKFARWLGAQANEAQFAEWLGAQTKDARKARFVYALSQPAILLGTRDEAAKLNYGGNAFEPIRLNLWLQFARGEALPHFR